MIWSNAPRSKCGGYCYFLLLIDAVSRMPWGSPLGLKTFHGVDRLAAVLSCNPALVVYDPSFSFKNMVNAGTWQSFERQRYHNVRRNQDGGW